MLNRRVLKDAVPEIEDVRAAGEGVKEPTKGSFHCAAARNQRQRIEIALDGKAFRENLRRPNRVNGLVNADRRDSSLARISAKLATCAFRKADDRDLRVTLAKSWC